MPADVKDIAKKAEASHSTVSRALKNHLGLARRTVERMQRFAPAFGLRTAQLVRSLRNLRSRQFEIISQRVAVPFYQETQGGLENMAPSSFIDNSLFTFVYRNTLGICRSTFSSINVSLRSYYTRFIMI